MRATVPTLLLPVALALLFSGCGLFSEDCPRTVRFVLTDSSTSQVTNYDECAVGPERVELDCVEHRWDLTGPNGDEGNNTTFIRYTSELSAQCGSGFSGRDGMGRLYTGSTLRKWDEGVGPFASGTWGRISGGQATTGSFVFYEKSELAP